MAADCPQDPAAEDERTEVVTGMAERTLDVDHGRQAFQGVKRAPGELIVGDSNESAALRAEEGLDDDVAAESLETPRAPHRPIRRSRWAGRAGRRRRAAPGQGICPRRPRRLEVGSRAESPLPPGGAARPSGRRPARGSRGASSAPGPRRRPTGRLPPPRARERSRPHRHPPRAGTVPGRADAQRIAPPAEGLGRASRSRKPGHDQRRHGGNWHGGSASARRRNGPGRRVQLGRRRGRGRCRGCGRRPPPG